MLGFAAAVWWSRLAQPDQHRWVAADRDCRLQQYAVEPADPDPKALACYGMLIRHRPGVEQLWLRFVAGRPISAVTTAFLAWCSRRLSAQGATALVLLWDNASWHTSQAVRQWLRTHNRQVKLTRQGVRIVVHRLPVKSPGLNAIEPKWVHGQRAVSELQQRLSATELEERICAYYGCARETPLAMPEKVP